MMTDWLGPAMFAGALALLSLGYPVAFSLGGVAILFGLIGIALGYLTVTGATRDIARTLVPDFPGLPPVRAK